MKKIAVLAVCLGLIFWPVMVWATPPIQYVRPNNQLFVKDKVVQYGQVLQVVGIPVANLGQEYHFQADQLTYALSDEDAHKIAELVADLLEKRLAEDDTKEGGEAEEVPTPAPNPDAVVLAKNALQIFVDRCASCHDEKVADGDISFSKGNTLALVDHKGKLSQSSIVWLAFEEVLAGRMPKGKPALSDQEVTILKDFATSVTKQERQNQ